MLADLPEYTLTRKKMKNLRMRIVAPHGEVKVSAPLRTPVAEIDAFVASRASWIRKMQARAVAMPVPLEAELIADRLCYWSTLTAWDAAAGKRLPRPASEMRASPQFRALHVLGHGTPEEDIEARRSPQLAPTAVIKH